MNNQCYAVWAPRGSEVVLDLDGERQPMRRDPDGWWRSARPRRAGQQYGFVVDGAGPFPDPRSPFQPLGVDGPSEHVDHDEFPWADRGWQAPPLASAVVYELHVGTFTPAGTFLGAIARLPHLVDLGVTHVELMPVAAFPGARGWGYDGASLFAPHAPYGRPEHLKQLVNACHDAGLAVMLDVVYNHFGPAGNYTGRFGPYVNPRYRTPWGDAVNLDAAGSDEVRRFFCDNAIMWLRDYHFDGLRLDAVHAMIDTSARHFLEELTERVATLQAVTGRHLVLVAESDLNDPRVIRPTDAAGYGIDAQWSDDFHHALHSVLTGERRGYYEDFGELAQLAAALRTPYVYAGTRSRFRQRIHGRPAYATPGWRFVIAAQNHDQIGNRPLGERLVHLVGVDRAKIAAALLLTAPYVPLLFQGEEWGASAPFQYFTAHDDPNLAAQVSAGRRDECVAFGTAVSDVPDPQAIETFNRSVLDWHERGLGRHAELLEWHRALLKLRRTTADLRDGNAAGVQVTVGDDPPHLIVTRGSVVIACNLSDRTAILGCGESCEPLLTSSAGVAFGDGHLTLPPWAVAIGRVSSAPRQAQQPHRSAADTQPAASR